MLHYINAMEDDVDIYVDGIGGLAVVGGDIRFTPAGTDIFGSSFGLHMDGHTVMGTEKDYKDLDDYLEEGKGYGGRLQRAYDLLASLAGYCSTSDFAAWFEGDGAKPI